MIVLIIVVAKQLNLSFILYFKFKLSFHFNFILIPNFLLLGIQLIIVNLQFIIKVTISPNQIMP